MNLQDVENVINKLKQSLNSCITIHLEITGKGQQLATASIRDNKIVPVYFTKISPDHSLYVKKLKVYSRNYIICCGKNIVVECASWFTNKLNAIESNETILNTNDTIRYLEGLKRELLHEKSMSYLDRIKIRSEALSQELGG